MRKYINMAHFFIKPILCQMKGNQSLRPLRAWANKIFYTLNFSPQILGSTSLFLLRRDSDDF